MSTNMLGRFREELDELEVEWTRTTPAECASVLRDQLAEPAVGTRLPFEGASLPESVNLDPTPADLDAARTGVTAAAFGIADYGSVVIVADTAGTEPVSLFPEVHIAVLREADIVPGMAAAYDRLGPMLREGKSAVIATGPSATADMGALVRGAHGPRDVHVVLLGEEDGGAEADDAVAADGGPRKEADGGRRAAGDGPAAAESAPSAGGERR